MIRTGSEGRDCSRPLAILGRIPNVSDFALRRILHAKQQDQALVVLDYQGCLAGFLTQNNQGHLQRRPLLWADLADRRKPTAIFRLTQTPGMRLALRTFLQHCVRHMEAPPEAAVLDAAIEVAWRLAENGSIGLAALCRGLMRPEICLGQCREPSLAEGLERLTRFLNWSLRFSGVWAASEGNNLLDIGDALHSGGTAWIEMPGSYFERAEHHVVSWMAEAALIDRLVTLQMHAAETSNDLVEPMIVHGFPPNCPSTFITKDVRAKRIGLFHFSASHPLPQAARAWIKANADCWIAGDVGRVAAVSPEFTVAETDRLEELKPGEVWVRSGADRKAVTLRARIPKDTLSLGQHARWHAQKLRRLSGIRQFSSAFADHVPSSPGNTSLYHRLCERESLFCGWLRVKSHNRQSHGSDQVTIDQFAKHLDPELDRLADDLSRGGYACRPLRTVLIPKPNGETRKLGIACVRDRVVQAACLHLIEPVFDPHFSAFSFGFRPGRNAHQAIALARSLIASGRVWAITADIRQCFDSLDHDVLLRLLGDAIGDVDLLQLIRHWLGADVLDFDDLIPAELGVPQGAAISPLLANVYLDTLDKAFEQNGNTFVRYADDYLVLCHSEAEARSSLQFMSDFLHEVLHLSLKPAKTQYTHLKQEADYLGFRLGVNGISIQSEKLDLAKRSIAGQMHILANAGAQVIDKARALFRMNALIRGFRNYFLIDDAPEIVQQLRHLDAYVDMVAQSGFDMKSDLGWVSREVFVPKDMATDESVHSAAMRVTGAYPTLAGLPPTGNAPDMTAGIGMGNQKMCEGDRCMAQPDTQGEPEPTTASDIVMEDGRLYVMTCGCYVTLSKGDLIVRKHKQECYRTPLSPLTLLYLEGAGIAMSADLTIRLSQMGVPVVFTPLIGHPGAIAQPVHTGRAEARRQQVLRRNDPDIIKVGLTMLSAKVGNQASVLKYFAKYRKRILDPAYPILSSAAEEIRGISSVLEGLDPSAAGIRTMAMGHEGRAAARYWTTLATLMPEQLAFPGRQTRHASDPMNAAINYVYGMLYGEIWRVLVRAGLDPYFGILHGSGHDQGSLVFDVIEEYRAPFADRLVLAMIGRGFVPELDKQGFLRTSTKRKLIHAFHRLWRDGVCWRGKKRTPREILELQTRSLRNVFLGQEEYTPFRFRW